MSRLLTPPEPLVTLRPQASELVVQEAIEERLVISFYTDRQFETPAGGGRILKGDQSTLVIHLCDGATQEVLERSANDLLAAIDLDDERYVFQARCMRPVPNTAPWVVYLLRPTSVAMLQRRRTRRCRPRQSQIVQMRLGSDEDASWVAGILLNASADGLCCRLRDEDAADLGEDQQVHLRFAIAEGEAAFEFVARLANLFAGGTPGHSLAGVEFVVEDEGALQMQQRLREALARFADT